MPKTHPTDTPSDLLPAEGGAGMARGFARLDTLPFPPFREGEVWLTGAGPGAPGLLTLLAYHALQQADVIVHDALVSAAVLDLAPQETERIAAGKRGGDAASMPQEEITALLIDLARKKRRVLRLKGGDPYLFGRGAEEALALAKAGIPFRIVPGIPAGIGGLAYAGVPVTAKDINSSVLFLTGHDKRGELPLADWQAIARAGEVIVLYMGLRPLARIAKALITAGREEETPVLILSRLALPDQQVRETTLAEIAHARLAMTDIARPALVVIGEAGRHRALLDWFTQQAKELPLG